MHGRPLPNQGLRRSLISVTSRQWDDDRGLRGAQGFPQRRSASRCNARNAIQPNPTSISPRSTLQLASNARRLKSQHSPGRSPRHHHALAGHFALRLFEPADNALAMWLAPDFDELLGLPIRRITQSRQPLLDESLRQRDAAELGNAVFPVLVAVQGVHGCSCSFRLNGLRQGNADNHTVPRALKALSSGNHPQCVMSVKAAKDARSQVRGPGIKVAWHTPDRGVPRLHAPRTAPAQ